MKLQAYDFNSPSLNLNSCLVNSTSESTPYVLLNGTVAVLANGNTKIRKEHVVLHQWILNTLKLERTDFLELSSLPLAELDQDITVSLRFDSFISLKQWDDFPTDGPLYLPHIWYKTWPEGLDKSIVEKSCSLLLLGTVLCNGAVVAIRYLDTVMVSLTIFISYDAFVCLRLLSIYYHFFLFSFI